MLAQTWAPVGELAIDVRSGLTKPGQKELPSKYLYDEVGSALFEVITLLPEYGLFRADERLIRQNAAAIAGDFGGHVLVAELGSGSGKKSFWILEALARTRQTFYRPIEISAKALEECCRELGQLPNVEIEPVQQTYLEGLRSVAAERGPGQRLLVLFLGSSIGNFETSAAERFLMDVRQSLIPGDMLLVSADLEKPVSQILPAYDDALGVTASFNLNVLARINRELNANFDLCNFRHAARYDKGRRRVEMHLLSTCIQTVSIPGAYCSISFQEGETIWTESSHKYRAAELLEMGCRTGFRPERQWIDQEWPFAQTLYVAS